MLLDVTPAPKYHSDKYRNSNLKISFEDCLDYLNEKLIDYCIEQKLEK